MRHEVVLGGGGAAKTSTTVARLWSGHTTANLVLEQWGGYSPICILTLWESNFFFGIEGLNKKIHVELYVNASIYLISPPARMGSAEHEYRWLAVRLRVQQRI